MMNIFGLVYVIFLWEVFGVVNFIFLGYFVDLLVVSYDGKFFIYVMFDFWGGEMLGCWELVDFKNWIYCELNWLIKLVCMSFILKGVMVWVLLIVCVLNGKFFMYILVGNEVWVGIVDQLLGLWWNVFGDKLLILENYKLGYYMIDVEVFIDDDGVVYFYWGLGWKWVNGCCFVVKLKFDMIMFDGELCDVMLDNYFEGLFLVKQGGKYFFIYFNGKIISDIYEVCVVVGDLLFGFFIEIFESLIFVINY